MKRLVFAFYNYYSESNSARGSAYEKALGSTITVILFNFLTVLNFLNLPRVYEFFYSRSKVELFAMIVAVLIPAFIILSILYKKREISLMKYDEKKLRRSGWFVCIYVLFSFILLIVSSR